ncbi:MAG: hypothetical protein ACRC7N_14350 [Clostridium sp.]
MNLVKKLNGYVVGRDRDKGRVALDRERDKVYKEINSIDDLVELIPFLLGVS